MPFTLTMPKLSPTMEDGVIAKWHVKEGDFVESGALLMEVETDKATVEHNALDEGYVRKIIVPAGEEASVNQPIAIFTETEDESIEGYEPEGEKKAPVQEEVVAEVKEEAPKKTEPAQAGMPAASFVPEEPLENYTFEMPTEEISKRVKASPLARRLAKERGLDLSTIKGSGPGGRIVEADLDKAQKAGSVVFGKREKPTIPPGTYEEEKLTPMRKVISKRLQEAKTFIPHIYVRQIVNAEPLMQLRQQLRNNDVKLTVNDFVVRACALALRKHPNINSGFNSVNNTIIRFKTIDISVAVSLPEGLITPVIRHADFKNIGELSVEMRSLAGRAKEGKLSMEEYKGGSFTVSNLGMFGITDFQAIINPPQAAILAVSGIANQPVVKDGKVVPGKTMSIHLSCDHRVIDGVAGAEFVKTVQGLLENPAVLIV